MTRLEYRRSLGLPDGVTVGKKGRSKFGAKKTVVDGITFDSRIEARRYGQLKFEERAGAIKHLRIHPQFEAIVNGILVCKYKADFAYRAEWVSPVNMGPLTVEDVKSEGTRRERDWKLRKRLIEAACGVTITEVIR